MSKLHNFKLDAVKEITVWDAENLKDDSDANAIPYSARRKVRMTMAEIFELIMSDRPSPFRQPHP